MDSIFRSQQTFFQSGVTKKLDFRIQSLGKLRNAIKANESGILQALHNDMRKPRFEAYSAEIALVLDEIKHSIRHLPKWVKPQSVPTPLPHFISSSKVYTEPLGVVLVIAPWNYPFQLSIAPLVAAIAAGNCTVIKPSEIAPETSKIITKMISETFESQYITSVEGDASTTQALLKNPFNHIFFTGGEFVGKVVMEAASKHLTPVTLELGGKSPCIVSKDFPLEHAARRIVWGKFFNAGQTCVAPDYLLVHSSIKEALLDKMKGCIREFFGDDPQKSSDYARIVSKKHFERLKGLIPKNAKVVAGGVTNETERYIAPTILDGIQFNDRIMAEEIFGPLLPVLTFETLDEAIQIVHDRPKPLALYFFSTHKSEQEKVLDKISFGGGCINDTLVHLSSVHLPFGGVGPSGMGSYHGKTGFDVFSHKKSILRKTALFDAKLRYAPYNERKLNLVRKLFG